MNKAISISGWMVGVLFAGMTFAGCAGRAGEVCDAECDCENCSDWKYDACKIQVNGAIDQADAYDCGDALQRLIDCTLDRARCNGHHWGLENDDCQPQENDYSDCVQAASSLDNQNPVTLCGCTCNCTTQTIGTTCDTGAGCCATACPTYCTAQGAGAFVPPAGEICTTP
jgi:hypothetical protein